MDFVKRVPRRPTIDLYHLGATLAAGALAGLPMGIGARVAMRVVAVLGDQPTGFSISGTLLILVVFIVAGLILAAPFALVLAALPGRPRLSGLLYGLLLTGVLIVPPFLNPQGELTLVSPLVGIALFGSLTGGYGILLGLLSQTPWLTDISAQKRVGLGWIILFAVGTGLTINSVAALSGSSSLPAAATSLLRDLGVGWQEILAFNGLSAAVITAAYLLLTGLFFVRTGHRLTGRLAALALLAFSAGFFHNGTAFSGMMRSFAPARLLPDLLQLVGLLGLLQLFYRFPDGRYVPGWSRPLFFIWTAVAVVWFFNPWPGSILDAGGWSEPLVLVLFLTILSSGVVAQFGRDRSHRARIHLLAATVALFGLVWALSLAFPDWKGRTSPRLSYLTPFAFGPYLLIWLGLPASFLLSPWTDPERRTES